MSVYQASRIDADGFYVEPELVDEGVILVDSLIVIDPVPEGLHRPKWNGAAWIEGLTPEELEERTKPIPPVKTPEQAEIDLLKSRFNQLNADFLSFIEESTLA